RGAASEFGTPGPADGRGAGGVRAVESPSEGRSHQPAVARSRSLRAVGRPRLDAALRAAAPDGLRSLAGRRRPGARSLRCLRARRSCHGRAGLHRRARRAARHEAALVTAREAAGNPLLELQRLGQSPWHDNIHRGLLEDGSLARMVRDGDITGLTSNPTIFEQAMAAGSAYDDSLTALVTAGRTPEGIVDTLVIDDIRAAADVFLPVFQRTKRADAY